MGNQGSVEGGGVGSPAPILLQIRQDLLHTTNSSKVISKIEDLVKSGKLPLAALERGNEEAINILKYVARLHGLPTCFKEILYKLLRTGGNEKSSAKGSSNETLNPCYIFKLSLALKYAVEKNSNFMTLDNLLTILLQGFPLNHATHGDFFKEETISQLMLSILAVLNPDRVSTERIDENKLWQLENYIGHINGKYKSEVRRSLEKLGYWSGSVSSRGKVFGRKGAGGNRQLLQSGDQVIADMQKKKGFNVSAHVVKTQQTEAVTTEENVSEKTQMSNISLSNALEQGRERTIQQARAREALEPPKSTTGSDRWWYKTTSTEVNNFLAKATREGPISPDDVQYLRNKFEGFKFSFSQSYSAMIKMIAEIFYRISKYQELKTDMIAEMLEIAFKDDKFDENAEGARLHLIQTADRHCNRIGRVPSNIYELLYNFKMSEEGSMLGDQEKNLIDDILSSDDSKVSETLQLAVNHWLATESSCMRGLNYIQKQILIESRRHELEAQDNLVESLLGSLVNFGESNHEIGEKVLEVLEDYLQCHWSSGYPPEQISQLIGISSNPYCSAEMKRRSICCVLRSMEKGADVEDYFQSFPEDVLKTQFAFLFQVILTTDDLRLKVLTIVMLSSVLGQSGVKQFAKLANQQHAEALRKQLERKDVLLKQGNAWNVVEEEELTEAFFEGEIEDEHEFVSGFVAKLLLILADETPSIVNDEQVFSTVSKVLLQSKGKMTRILCAEFIFRMVTTSGVVLSTPILNRIQEEVFSSVGDIRVYTTAAYCTSLANQAKTGSAIDPENVSFLVNLYAFKKIMLDKVDMSQWINPKILEVFHKSCKNGGTISEQVCHLLALILNNTCADSEQSPDYPIVKDVLDCVTIYCDQHKSQASQLPSSIVEAVENLLLESDVFDEICAGIIEKCMLAGRWVSESVLEEFAKYLWHEPQVAIPMLRRLSIANENQELSQAIFNSFQMELIGLRLFPMGVHKEGITVLAHQNLESGSGDHLELFQCLSNYVSSGMLISRLNLEVVSNLLKKSTEGKKLARTQKENVIRCLTIAASNGQSLPSELVQLSLKEVDDLVDFALQLDFATAVVRRSQQLPEQFLAKVNKNLANNSTCSDEKGRKLLALLKTITLHNQQLPPEMTRAFIATVFKNKEALVTPDMLASLTRLVSTKQVEGQEELKMVKEIFLHAMSTNNLTIVQAGVKGLKALPESHLNEADNQKISVADIDNTKAPSQETLVQTVQVCVQDPLTWQDRWTPVLRAQLEKELLADVGMLEKTGKILTSGGKERLSEFEEILVEILCITLITEEAAKDTREMCGSIVEKVIEERNYELNGTCRSYLSDGGNDKAKELLKLCKEPEVALDNGIKERKKSGFLGRLFRKKSGKSDKKQKLQTKMSIEVSDDNLESIENELINGDGVIPPQLLQAYLQKLSQETTLPPKWEACSESLASYFKDNQAELGFTDKRLILETFAHLAKYSDQLPEKVMDVVKEGVFSEDPLIRSLTFSILLILRGKLGDEHKSKWEEGGALDTVWINSFVANLYTCYEQIHGAVEQDDMEETTFAWNLVQVMQTLKAIDLKSLSGKGEMEWAVHLMTFDTVIALASTVDEQLSLYPLAKKMCSLLEYSPLTRLYVLNGVIDYIGRRTPGGVLPISRVIQLITLFLKDNKQKGVSSFQNYDSDWIENAVIYGLAALIKNGMGAPLIVCKVVVEQALQSPNQIHIPVLDNVIAILSSQDKLKMSSSHNIYELRTLIGFMKRMIREGSVELMATHLKQLVQSERSLPVKELKSSIQTAVILSSLPNGPKDTFQMRTLVELQTQQLLCQNYDFTLLSKLFRKVGKRVGNTIKLGHGLQILENIRCQLKRYHVASERFGHIYSKLKETDKISDWVTICNELVMEHLYSGSQGEKTASTIAEEYVEINKLSKESSPEYLKDFSNIVNVVRGGYFKSKLETSEKYIREWTPQDIWQWAFMAKSLDSGEWTEQLLKESLAVISRACEINRNYRLSPIQILSVYSTMTGEGRLGGRLLQVATGSGKSTIIVSLAIIKCLKGAPVDVYTSSPVLAERDAKGWAPFYKMFGLSCDHNGDKGSGYVKGEKTCYKKHIVYGDTSQFQFDTLRHEYSGLGTRAERKYGYAVVDEVDSMLVDDSSKLARLSSTLPGMDLLQILYHFIWQRLHDIQQRMYSVQGQVYYLEGKRSVDDNGSLYYTFSDAKNGGEERTIRDVAFFIIQNQDNLEELENALIFKVNKIETFVTGHLKDYARALLGVSKFDEKNDAKQLVQQLPLPKHLQIFAKGQVDNWVDSAMTAVAFQENVHYVVDRDQIKPVDYQSTGIIQASTNWNNGLHQFLQIKHSLKVSTETVTTNFLSNMAMFQKYGADLTGFTGTLGSDFGQKVLKDVYGVETAIIPELYYKRFQSLSEQAYPSNDKAFSQIVHSAMHESQKGRAVLIICQTIQEADQIGELLEIQNKNASGGDRATCIKLYTRNDLNQEKYVQQVIEGDIIVATNLAGRGTDINTTKVEGRGGLHVILTFLPDSLRVEEQAFGRTARQGNKGSGELVVVAAGAKDCIKLKESRDEGERQKLTNFQNKELALIQTKDELFAKFCKVYSRVRAEFTSSIFGLTPLEVTRLQAIEQNWATFLKRLDDGTLKIEDAKDAYSVFESNLEATYKDIDKTIHSTDNCFYWIQLGNEHFKRWNVTKDNTGEAHKYFENGIRDDTDFAAGAHAGLGFCLLRGKTHYVGSNSHKDGYKNKAIGHLKDSLKILYTEISYYSTAQTLFQNRGGRTDSELFKQLTEKTNLVGEYARNVEGIIATVERSLRAVYAVETDPSRTTAPEKRWRLNDDKPELTGYSSGSSKFSLEFHDLTSRYDCGTRDQAAITIGDYSKNVIITCHNQNLLELVKAVGDKFETGNMPFRGTKTLPMVELHGVNNVPKLLNDLEGKVETFSIKVTSTSKELPLQLGKVLKGKKATVSWMTEDGSFQMTNKRIVTLDGSTNVSVPDKSEYSILMDFKHDETESLKLIDKILSEEKQDVSVIFTDLKEDTIVKGWNVPPKEKEKEGEDSDKEKVYTPPGILQIFQRNTITFQNLSTKSAKSVVETLRDKNIQFELRLENLTLRQAQDKLKNSGRSQEDITEKKLKEMGEQFSSTYIPLEVIRELVQRGLVLLPEYEEKQFVPWRSVISVGIIATCQVACGAVLVCTGFGATVGLGLITEGMSDYVTAYRVYSSRQFSWKDYAIQKSISLTISVVSMGLSSLKDGAKGVQTLAQGAATEVAEQAGQKVITGAAKRTLNESIKVAHTKLKSLVVKQIVVQGTETAVRVGLNTVMETIVQFSFDSVRSHLKDSVQTTVSNEMLATTFIEVMGNCSVVNKGQLRGKVQGWMNEVTHPQSGSWTKAWDSVGLPLCQGILSDPQYLGSKFSMAFRLVGIINGCKEIATVTEKVCGHILTKMKSECRSYTASYSIQEAFGLTAKQAEEILQDIKFGDKGPFHVKNIPKGKLGGVDSEDLKKHFQKLHDSMKGYNSKCEEVSRIISTVTEHLTDHITQVANRQLAAPITTAAVGKLVATLSQKIQSNYLVSDAELSDDQKKVRDLKKKDGNELTAEEKAFLLQNDKPVTFVSQIRGNAKDYTVAYQQRDIVAVISTIQAQQQQQQQSNNEPQKTPDKFTKDATGAIGNILGGGPADMTVVFLLAQLNNADVKLVDDPNYEPTDEDKKSGVKIIVWEKPEPGQPIGHYMLKDAKTGQVTDFVGGGDNDCAYNVLASVTGKSPDELRLQSAVFIACNQEKFGEYNESAKWIRDRYPQEANTFLHVGGRRSGRPTKYITETVWRKGARKNSEDDEEEDEKLLVGRGMLVGPGEGRGSSPHPDAKTKQEAKELTDLLKTAKDDDKFKITDSNGNEREISGKELKGMLGGGVVPGHLGNAKMGTRGTDKNMTLISKSLNTVMSVNFETKCKSFLDAALEQGLIKQGEMPLLQEFSAGPLKELKVGDKTYKFADDVTCTAYLEPPEGISKENLAKLEALFNKEVGQNKLEHRQLHKMDQERSEARQDYLQNMGVTDDVDNDRKKPKLGYAGTFTNTAKSAVIPPVWTPHGNTVEVESSSTNEPGLNLQSEE